jgi:hypothetical protein
MRRVIVAGIAMQIIAFPAMAQTGATPVGPSPVAGAPSQTAIPDVAGKPSGPAPTADATAPSKTNTGMTTPPTPTPQSSMPAPTTGGPAATTTSPSTTAGASTAQMTPAATGAAGANSFTESQARHMLEEAGYSQIGSLAKDQDGIWRGRGTKGSSEASIGVDFKGHVVTR